MILQFALLALLQSVPEMEAVPPPMSEHIVTFECRGMHYAFSYLRGASLSIGHIRIGPRGDRLKETGSKGREALTKILAQAEAIESMNPYCSGMRGGVKLHFDGPVTQFLAVGIHGEGIELQPG